MNGMFFYRPTSQFSYRYVQHTHSPSPSSLETPSYKGISDQKIAIVINVMYSPIAFCAKLSLFLLYYRLFGRHRWIRYSVYLGIGSIAAVYTADTIAYGYLCFPHGGQSWIEAVAGARCFDNSMTLSYVRIPFNILSDLYLFILPLPAVWQLHLPLRKRLGIAGIFMTGSL